MKGDSRLRTFIQSITLWKSLRALAILVLASVFFSVGAEAYNLGAAFVWVKERVLKLMWDAPTSPCDHYRLEVSKTNLLSEPVTTYLSYEYTKEPCYEIELGDHYSYSPYGVLSGFSDSSAVFAYRSDKPLAEKPAGEPLPTAFSLSQNYPNPFNSHTNIEYQVCGSGSGTDGTKVDLAIYNVLGQRVRALVDDVQPPGEYLVVWDARDDRGREVAAGHYFYQITAGKFSACKKIIYLR